jgi:hypothetical protein
MVFYKVRRKSDGKYARNWRHCTVLHWTKDGQTFSEKALHHAKRLFRNCNDYDRGRYEPSELELVKFTINGTSCTEEVIATGGRA